MSTGRRVFRFLLLFFLIFAIVSLSQNIARLLGQGLVVKEEKEGLETLKMENQRLKAHLDYVGTDEFLEEEARNSLGLTRGESILILPSNFFLRNEGDGVNSSLPYWRQWWELFFGDIIFTSSALPPQG